MSARLPVELFPVGGVGEFGRNLLSVRCGDDAILIDAGAMFPDGDADLGVDRVLPDFGALDGRGRILAAILTHGHEDHVGAVPWLLRRHPVPVHATAYTRALVRRRLAEHDGADARLLAPLPEGDATLEIGPFRIRAIEVAHSIPQTRMLAIEAGGARILHSADFKLASGLPGEERTDEERLRALGEEGVDLLLVDSTNAGVPGRTPPESVARDGLRRATREAPGAVLVTTFSSHVRRVEALGDIARETGRRVALLGASLRAQVDAAEQLGLIRFPAGTRVHADELARLPRRRILAVAAGTQAEPRSALSRIAEDRHPSFHVEEGDRLLHAARVIPGNERAVGRLHDRLRRFGVEVFLPGEHPIHVSGHPAADDVAELLAWVRPRFVLPVHGEPAQLAAARAVARDSGLAPPQVLDARNGDTVIVDGDRTRVVPGPAPGALHVDAQGELVPWPVLSDRRWLAHEGVVVAVVPALLADGRPAGEPRVESRGFAPGDGEPGARLIHGAKQVIVDSLSGAPRAVRNDREAAEETVRDALRRYLRRETGRRPAIVAIVATDTDGSEDDATT